MPDENSREVSVFSDRLLLAGWQVIHCRRFGQGRCTYELVGSSGDVPRDLPLDLSVDLPLDVLRERQAADWFSTTCP